MAESTQENGIRYGSETLPSNTATVKRSTETAGSVRIPVGLEPPSEERQHVIGYIAHGEMARDRL